MRCILFRFAYLQFIFYTWGSEVNTEQFLRNFTITFDELCRPQSSAHK